MKRINSQIVWRNISTLHYVSNMALYKIQLIFTANDIHVPVFINLREASVFHVIIICIAWTIFVKGNAAALRVSLHFECHTTQSSVSTCATISVTANRFWSRSIVLAYANFWCAHPRLAPRPCVPFILEEV